MGKAVLSKLPAFWRDHDRIFYRDHVILQRNINFMVNMCPMAWCERDRLQAELFEDPPVISDGTLTLNERPGLGLTLSSAALEKFGELVL